METSREAGLIEWQWSVYPKGHRDRTNLLVHILTVPLFILGTGALVLSAFVASLVLAASGLAAMVLVMVVQGRTHKRESTPPAPFQGPLDVLARIFLEQFFTFPRYVLSGELTRAWRGQPVNRRKPVAH
jgi:membrane-bound ClpP family serine protease